MAMPPAAYWTGDRSKWSKENWKEQCEWLEKSWHVITERNQEVNAKNQELVKENERLKEERLLLYVQCQTLEGEREVLLDNSRKIIEQRTKKTKVSQHNAAASDMETPTRYKEKTG